MSESDALSFGNVRILPSARQVMVAGRPVELGARAFDMLLALAQRPGRIVSKKELLAHVWPTTVVEEANLRVCVSAIRKCLGAELISTIPGRGYQLNVQVSPAQEDAHPSADQGESPPTQSARGMTLFGRDSLLERWRSSLARSSLVTLTGASGSGKTALARHIFEEARAEGNIDVRWIDLAALSRDDLVVPTIARALELTSASAAEMGALAAFLRSRSALLVIDNAEHLVERVAAIVETLVRACPRLKLLVTSQLKLDLADETVLPVPPLELAPPNVPSHLARQYAAVAMFLHRCEQAGRPLPRDASTLDAVADVCRRVDGLPLAIDYAAALAPVVGLDGVRQALDERLLSLQSSRRDLPERQRSLRATLQWSHGLLDDGEQMTFRRLGVFHGGCSLELFRDVVAVGVAEPWRAVEALSELIDRSLVMLVPGQVPRYRLLETALAFARELLAASGELPRLQAEHAMRVTVAFEDLYLQCWQGKRSLDSTVERLLLDIDNARAAFEWAVSNDPALALRLCVSMTFALDHSSGWSEAGRCFALTEPFAEQALPLESRARWALSAAQHWTLRDHGRASRWAEFAAAAYRHVDEQGLFMALVRQAECAFQVPSSPATKRALLAELERLNNPAWPPPVRSAGALAIWKLYSRLDTDQALTRFQSALAAIQDHAQAASVLRCNVMELQNQDGRYGDAIEQGELLRSTLQGTRHHGLLGFALVNLTHAYIHSQRWDEAWKTAEQGVRIALPHELLHIWTVVLSVFAIRHQCYEEAALLIGFADEGYRRRGHRRGGMEERLRLRSTSACRLALGEVRFDHCCKEGAGIDDDAVMRMFERLVLLHER